MKLSFNALCSRHAILAFAFMVQNFNQYLKGEDSPLLTNNNKYKEVRLEYK